ncbi:MAG TPA: 2-C-methyl-D-erythritol 2,4-cyclodiphosphate synthase [Blastocatellia bacterium]|jgi:2-C-methyl-D-erythritol 2,4-cyclodiphosphate synthase|nr:2-C-methyl-D-erythritol 2,4-cyclodiphosphate synthase [Blastocatellia bacterium]
MGTSNRVGTGYDIHRLVEGRKLILGGIEIPFERGLLGHSDSDVLTHAICDALLGAAGVGDIGTHFPDTDPRFSGASSLTLLAQVCEILEGRGFSIANIDATILAERPRLSSHIQSMRERLASVLKIDVDRVSIKAKTSEGLGAVGRGEAIEAHAVALIYLDAGADRSSR